MSGLREALSRIRWRGPTLLFMNAWYNRLYFGGTVAMGPIASVLIHAGLVWGVVRLALGTFPLIATRPVLIVAAACAALPLAEAVSVLANGRGVSGWLEVLGQAAFLAVLPVLSRLSITPPRDVLKDCSLAAAAGGAIMLGISLIQFFHVDMNRAEGGLGNPGIMAVISLLLAVIALCGLAIATERQKLMLVSGAACALGALMFSGMRGVIVFVPLALLVVALATRGIRMDRPLGSRVGLALVILAIALVLTAPMLSTRALLAYNAIADFMATGTTNEYAIGARIDLWRAATALIAEDPWFGHGPDTPRLLIEAIPATPSYSFSHFHNFALNAMVRGGIVELLAVLAIPVALALAALRPAIPASLTAEQRAGRAILLVLPIIFYLPALVGLLFDHDVLNAMFVYSVIVGLRLMDGGTSEAKPYLTRA